jgi:proteasome lid subunit RPN8/RPN11
MEDTRGSPGVGDDGFRPVEVVPEPVHDVSRELARSGYRVYRGMDGFEAAVAEHVVERALAIGKKAAPNEWYGLLVGRLYRDERSSHVVVLGLVPDPEASAGTGYVKTTHASEFRTRALARLVYPDAVILGWIHGHVRYGARYSATDRENQATWTQSHAIGIVVDPFDRTEIAVYRGPNAELLAAAADEPSDTLRAPPPVPPEPPTEGASAPKPSTSPAPTSRLVKAGIIVSMLVALGCLLAIGLLARRVRTLEARVQAAEAAQACMAAELGTILDALPLEADEDDSTEAGPHCPLKF